MKLNSSPNDLQNNNNLSQEDSGEILYDYLFKIVTAGDMGVGKTCVIKRFVEEEFFKYTTSTIGVDFSTKKLVLEGGRCVRLQVWDTAGQERYSAITPNFFRGCHGILIIFDITNKESFNRIPHWIDVAGCEINEETNVIIGPLPYTQIILIGNKCDLEQDRQVKKEDANKYASKYGIKYIETSAKTGDNITDTFTEMAKTLFEDHINFLEKASKQELVKVISPGRSLLEEKLQDDLAKKNKKCC